MFRRVFFRYILLGFLLANSCFAVGSCKVTRSDGVTVDSLIVTLPRFTPDEFDPNIPLGTVIFSSSGNSSGMGGSISCTSAIGTVIYVGSTAPAPGLYNTYPTTVAGVGVRIRGGINPESWWPQYRDSTSTTYTLDAASNFTVELVKTGRITSAGEITGELGRTVVLNEGLVARRIRVNGSIPIKPRVPTCSLLSKSVPVNFEQVKISSLMDGALAGVKKFDLKLRCSGGEEGSTTRMFVTFTDASNPGNTSGVLSLSAASKASGVGIQIRRADGQVVRYGPDSSQAGNVNQWQIGEFGNVDVVVPLQAGYIKTASQVTPGSANGSATFTLSYQ
ncbi:fimbrial protein [Pseudomonas aeruginosa]|uniref:fimbrial protein n=1 Tax=Pseudomonas aeruginosa TaxID=287 RepID=UPI003984D0AF